MTVCNVIVDLQVVVLIICGKQLEEIEILNCLILGKQSSWITSSRCWSWSV